MERLSFMRIIGYAFHATWVLSIFYSVFFYTSTINLESALYLNQFVSQLTMVLTVLSFVIFAKFCSNMILSKPMIYSATAALAVATIALIFIDTEGVGGTVLVVISACMSGAASGIFFLGWVNLFADGGARTAMLEFAAAYIVAAIIAMILQYLPPLSACILTAVFACGSGILLSISSGNRQTRLKPKRQPQQPQGLKWIILRGMFACVSFGFVSGFANMLSGYSPYDVGHNYGVILMAGITAMSLIVLLVAVFHKDHPIVHINRAAFLAVILGCFLLALSSDGMAYQNALIVGGYICFFITALVIAIDISNYYSIHPLRIVGSALLALFLGELIGYMVGYFVGTYHFVVFPLETFAFLLCGILLAADLFLLTEKDMVQFNIGSLFDDPGPAEPGSQESTNNYSVDWIDEISGRLCQQHKLSARESEVLPFVLRGRTIARIQENLHISGATVHTHIRHIYTKVGVTNRQELLDLVEEQKNLANPSQNSQVSQTPPANQT